MSIAYHAYYIAENDRTYGYGMTAPSSPQSVIFRLAVEWFKNRFIRTNQHGNTNHFLDSISVFPNSDNTDIIVRVTLYNFFCHGTFMRDVPAEEFLSQNKNQSNS